GRAVVVAVVRVLGVLLGALAGVRAGVLARVLLEPGGLRGVDDVLRRALLDALVDRGLEAREVDDEVGVADPAHLRGGELEVVGLRRGRREVGDGDVLAADLLDDVLERVEGREHLEPPVVTASAAAGGACRDERGAGEGGGGDQGAAGPCGGAVHGPSLRLLENGCQNRFRVTSPTAGYAGRSAPVRASPTRPAPTSHVRGREHQE